MTADFKGVIMNINKVAREHVHGSSEICRDETVM